MSPRLGRKKQILVFHSSNGASWSREREGIASFARSVPWQIHIVDSPPGRDETLELLRFWHPDGVIAECGADSGGLFSPRLFGEIPAVYLAGDVFGLAETPTLRVNHDSEDIGRVAAKEFLSAGLKSAGFYGFSGLYWSDARRDAFERALRLNSAALAALERPLHANCGYKPLEEFRRWVLALEKPCGILCANDFLAQEAIGFCEIAALDVPGDVAVLGIDNDEIVCETTNPTISSVRPDFEEAGYLSAKLLSEEISRPKNMRGGDVQRYFGSLGIIHRASTMRLARKDAAVSKACESIRLRACDGLQPKDVAAETSVSRRTLEIRFRKLLGRSILEEIYSVRLEKVKELLACSDIPLESIAAKCGWKSASRLRVFFKTAEGRTMGEWRAERRTERGNP